MKTFIVFLGLTSGLLAPAHADQHAWVTREYAGKAIALASRAPSVRLFCAPCGDTQAEEVSARAWSMQRVESLPGEKETDYWKVSVNRDEVDWAYVYVPVRRGVWPWRREAWRNAAMVMGLPVADVPEYLPKTLEVRPASRP